MTELLNQDRLRQIAALMDHTWLPSRRQTPTMQWVVDATTGRPVARWVLSDEQGRAPLN
jgi:hypothetical protein